MSTSRGLVVRAVALLAMLLAQAAPAQNLVVNGDFSAHLDGWTAVTVAAGSFAGFPQFMVDPGVACLASRNGNPRLMINVPDEADGYVVQTLTLPAEPASLSLSSWNNLDATTATVSIQTLADGLVYDLESWDPPPVEAPGLTCSGAQPIAKTWDLSAFAGEEIALRLRARGGTGYNGVIADFDDVAIVAATTTSTTTSTSTTSTTLEPPLCGNVSPGDAIACLCEADVPEACTQFDVPDRIAHRFEVTCRTARRGVTAGSTRRARRLLGKARRKMKALVRAVEHLGKLDGACIAALVERGHLVEARIEEARDAVTAP